MYPMSTEVVTFGGHEASLSSRLPPNASQSRYPETALGQFWRSKQRIYLVSQGYAENNRIGCGIAVTVSLPSSVYCLSQLDS